MLKTLNFFSEFTDEELGEIENKISVKSFMQGTILREKAGQHLYCHIVRSGEAEVIRGYGTPDEIPLAVIKEGDFFGEMSFLTDSPRGATVRAKTDIATVSFPMGILVELERRNPQAALKIYRQFLMKTIERLRTANCTIEELQTKLRKR